MEGEESSPRTKRIPKCRCSGSPLDTDCFVISSSNPKVPGKETIQAYFHNFYYALFYSWNKIDNKDPKVCKEKMKTETQKLLSCLSSKERQMELPKDFNEYRFMDFKKATNLEQSQIYSAVAKKYPIFSCTNFKVSEIPPKKKKSPVDEKHYYTYYLFLDGTVRLVVSSEPSIRISSTYTPRSYAVAQNGAKPRQFVVMFNIEEKGKKPSDEENLIFKERFPDFELKPTGLVIVFGKTLINGLKADVIPIQDLKAMKDGSPVNKFLSDVISESHSDIVTHFRSSLFSSAVSKKEDKKKEEEASDDFLSNFIPPETVPENKRPSSATKAGQLKKKKDSKGISESDFD